MLTQTPHTFVICIPSYLLHYLTVNIQGRKNCDVNKTHNVFMNSFLNEEAPTQGKISESLKMGGKERPFSVCLRS